MSGGTGPVTGAGGAGPATGAGGAEPVTGAGGALPVTIRTAAGATDVQLRTADDDVTLGDVLAEVGAAGAAIGIGPVVLPPSSRLVDAGVRPGGTVVVGGALPEPELPAGLVVAVVAGIDAGRSIPLRPGEHRIGRAFGTTVRLRANGVSKHHATLRLGEDGAGVEITDAGSANGTRLADRTLAPADGWVPVETGALIQCGPAAFVIRSLPEPDPPRSAARSLRRAPSGPVPYYRSPLDNAAADELAIELPAPPRPKRRSRLSVLSLAMPLVLGGVLVAVTHQLSYALFILISPVMVLSSWLERKIRGRRSAKRSRRRFGGELDDFAEEVLAARDAELRRRRICHPDLAEVTRRAAVLSTSLWGRRPGHPDLGSLVVGIGDLRWSPPVGAVPSPGLGDLDQVIEEGSRLAMAPVVVTAAPGEVVGLAGSRSSALATARGMLIQAAVLHGPADLRILVVCAEARAADWDWVKWLPHAQPAFAGGRPLIGCVGEDRAAIEALLGDAGSAATVLAVIDVDGLADSGDLAVRALLRERSGRTTGMVVAATVDGLPDLCSTVVEAHAVAGELTCRWPRQGGRTVECLAAGVTVEVAEATARSLARVADPEAAGGSVSLPTIIGVGDLLGLRGASADGVLERWATGDRAVLPLPLGVGEAGPAVIDLAGDGPHVAIVGARGSGKTECLTSFVVALAAAAGPERLWLVCWGETFAGLRPLPQMASEVSRFDDDAVRRVVDGLDREIVRRERIRLEAGDDPDGAIAAQPSIVVAIDDLDTILRVAPRTAEDLVRLLRRSRGLGIHVLWTSGRTVGQSLGDLLDLSPVKVVLRTATATESAELVGTDRPGRLDRSLVGRAYVLGAVGEAYEVQTPAVHRAAPRPVGRLSVDRFDFRSARQGPHATGRPADADIRRLVPTIVDAGVGRTRPPDVLSSLRAAEALLTSPGLPELLGISDVTRLDPHLLWRRGRGADLLKVPIGVDPHGAPVILDLKESAQEGMGPHGLLVGATGSGKSELLRTLVTALALTHDPEVCSFVLVDFKGGANFAGMAALPHVAGMITNLADDLALADRVLAALDGEQRRRQEVLARAGNLASVREYRAARDAGAELEALPDLLIVVDEFAELLDKQPEFIDFFLTIGRVGRSLGIHLLLASQRLEEGKLRGLDTYLSYRLGLRTFSAPESRTVLGVPDAYSLPSAPGGGYLKVGTDLFERFQASYVSGPAGPAPDSGPDPDSSADPPTVMAAVVANLVGAAASSHQIWLPPLGDAIPLNALLGDAGFVDNAERGLVAAGWPGVGRLVVPLGLLDEPDLQRQRPLVVDLAGAEANLVVVGAPQTGKSTLARSLVLSLAVTHTPREVQCYAVDFGGGTLESLAGLPHVGSVASRLEGERVRRLIGHVERLLAEREQLFRSRGIDGAASFRQRVADGDLPADVGGDVFLIIDGWGAFRTAYEALEATVADIAARGLGFGLHVVLTANRWTELRPAVLESFGGRMELRANNPADSFIDRRKAATIRADQPGRGLTAAKRFFQVALPRLDSQATVESVPAATKVAVELVASRWRGEPAPPVQLLPARVLPSDLPGPDPAVVGVPVAITEDGLAPWHLDLSGAEPHFLVYGDGESGKTTFLRSWLTGLAAHVDPAAAQVLVVDYRRTLLDVLAPSHRHGYGPSEPAVASQVAALAETLRERLPAAEVTAAQLRDRSWWTGPDLYVVVDDYDLVVTPSGNPLSPLLPYLAQARDVGFHLIVARRITGLAKALYEPVMSRTREVSEQGLILSGDRGEGPVLGGYRAGDQAPGRGILVRRRRPPVLVQVADTPAPE